MKPYLVIAGAGQTGREIAGRLIDKFDVLLIDTEAGRLAVAQQEIGEVATLQGDATSPLVLQKADMEKAHTAIGLTGDDQVNLEFCKTASQRFGVNNCYSVVTRRTRIAEFNDLGIEVLSRAYAVASILQTRVNPGRRTTSEIGLGAGELFEVTVMAHSPVVGRSLSSFHGKAWLAGAIYREGKLVVPHGSTVIQVGDRVLLIGDPAVLPAVANFFRTGASEFPLQYGSYILVSDPEKQGDGFSLPEALNLARHTNAQGLKVLSAPYQEDETLAEVCRLAEVPSSIKTAPEDWPRRVTRILNQEDAGCVVLPGPKQGLLDWLGLGHKALFEMLRHLDRPCLLSRGTFPYRKILLVVSKGEAFTRAAELAMEITRHFDAEITALAVLPPEFVSGTGHHEELKQAIDHACSMGSYYSLKVESRLLEGHPVHTVVEEAAHYDLVVLGYAPSGGPRWFSVDAAQHLLLRLPCSAVVLTTPVQSFV